MAGLDFLYNESHGQPSSKGGLFGLVSTAAPYIFKSELIGPNSRSSKTRCDGQQPCKPVRLSAPEMIYEALAFQDKLIDI